MTHWDAPEVNQECRCRPNPLQTPSLESRRRISSGRFWRVRRRRNWLPKSSTPCSERRLSMPDSPIKTRRDIATRWMRGCTHLLADMSDDIRSWWRRSLPSFKRILILAFSRRTSSITIAVIPSRARTSSHAITLRSKRSADLISENCPVQCFHSTNVYRWMRFLTQSLTSHFCRLYTSLCPNAWVEKWNEQIEEGRFPGRIK